ncbi:hypothetical protein RIVM261_012150 [Rivularia sp. IAM M-261]|nr:hypothetical protein CAL7716_071120 [Calothrix sp. PCC 7716]GJD16259.1 hypothetical protein RIVM261_012150 [Rivularia sp. IAM M-261]
MGYLYINLYNLYYMSNIDSCFITPAHIFLVKKRQNWEFVHGEVFWNPLNLPDLSLEDTFSMFGTSIVKVTAKLLQINDGQPGYYLADIAEKKYYYCSENLEDIRTKLRELGIGKLEPH